MRSETVITDDFLALEFRPEEPLRPDHDAAFKRLRDAIRARRAIVITSADASGQGDVVTLVLRSDEAKVMVPAGPPATDFWSRLFGR